MLAKNDLKNKHHIAGIIPIAGEPLQFNMPWQDSLLPIHDNYHAIERAVNSAAVAGCNTIWIVARRDMMPMIKKKVGEWIYDPTTTWISPRPFWSKREIPIYYIGIRPRDRKRRDSFAWSCLYGSRVAAWISRKISKWVVPRKFLVISPYGVISEKVLLENRGEIRSSNNIAYSYNGKTFMDDEFLPFTFDENDYIKCRNHFKEIYSGRDTNLKFSEVFAPLKDQRFDKLDPAWYYKLDNWENYKQFISSVHNNECSRPKYLRPHKWHGFIDPGKGVKDDN